MAINIGHASLDENGKISGGTAGDQTGKEVCVRTWYNKPWGFVLRCTDPALAEKMAKACEAGCANNKIGYDQNQRNTLNTQAKAVGYDLSKITTACECDCSSFMTVCAQAAGIEPAYSSGNAPTTSTMQARFTATGKFTVLTDSKYLTSDKYLKRGDILVKAGSHTVMALGNGSLSGNTTSTSSSTATTTTSSGSSSIKSVQTWLNSNYSAGLAVDGVYGPKTKAALVKALQTWLNATYNAGLVVDGIFGAKTKAAVRVLKKGSSSTGVKILQGFLICNGYDTGGFDGEFGTKTDAAVRSYQGKKGITVDGQAGQNTFAKLAA